MMPKSRDSFCVLKELKNLSDEADQLADYLPKVSDLEPFFNAIRDTIIQIRDCTSLKQLKEIPSPPDFNCYLKKKENEEKVKVIHTPETQKEHVHTGKIVTSVFKTAEKDTENGRIEKNVTSASKSCEKDKVLETCLPLSEEKSNSIASLTKLNNQTPKLPKASYNVETPKLFKTPCTTLRTLKSPPPVLNRTVTKETNPVLFNKNLSHAAQQTLRITRSGSRNKAEGTPCEVACTLEISSSLKQRLQDENKNSSSMVRSGSKRKSASSTKSKSKKPKMEVKKISKTSQPKATVKSNVLRPANGPTHNPKAPAIIVPTLKHSITSDVNLKEKKLEEMLKKEEKANENRKKVLAERQLKADDQKKKREEKMEKALQKRLLLDKEKDHDRSMDTKMSQAKVLVDSVKKPILKQKSKELQEQQAPEACPPVNQKEMTVETANKTPAKKSPHESETYDLTPAPDSSTYDFSDEEENEPKGKPIPSWAQGVVLKYALMHQYYNPPDTSAIFGTYIEAPDLAELFGVKKNYYYKRTSSAVWNTTPC